MKEAPGHAVIEMALVRLYEVTGDRKYLDECKFFLDCRGSRTFDPGSSDLRVNGNTGRTICLRWSSVRLSGMP